MPFPIQWIGKPPWSPPQRRNPPQNRKNEEGFSLALHKKSIYLFRLRPQQIGGPRRGPGGDRKAPWSPPQRRNPPQNRKSKEGFSFAFHKKSVSCGRFRPPAGGRGTFHHWKVPKGCRGRPKGACLMAAPGPPVAKQQCTASLAGARPAGFTSVPGRATVAFKVGFHFVKAKSLRDPRIRLWRKRGLAQLIPPPAPRRRFIPGVSARDHYGRNTLLRYVPRLRCHAKCVPDAALVGQEAG